MYGLCTLRSHIKPIIKKKVFVVFYNFVCQGFARHVVYTKGKNVVLVTYETT